MRGFAQRTTVEAARAWVDALPVTCVAETVALARAADRVLVREVVSPVDVPGFDRAMMDGFALRGAETHGASPYNPLEFRVVGEALPGRPSGVSRQAGEVVRIMTGAPLPAGCDAVLPVEQVELHGDRIAALGEVPPGRHVGRRGEDVAAGAVVLPAGRRLRPQDLGVLSSIGGSTVDVARRPRVRLVITGNELLPAGSRPEGHRIVDANGPMLAALVDRDGGEAVFPGIVPDAVDAIRAALIEECRRDGIDVILVSGGSSVGHEDHAPALVAELGELPIHGVAMRPSSPAGMGRIDGRPVFLLPGNPVSCLCAYDFFAGRTIRRLAGRPADWPYPSLRAPLARKLSSVVGRVDYCRVRLIGGHVEPLATSGAAILSSTVRADGFVVVPEASEGYPPGATVDVWLYDAVGHVARSDSPLPG